MTDAAGQTNGSHPGAAVPVAARGGDGCPHCGAEMAADQRYCLKCGQRRGEPRLPFMDAVVFMESMRQPPPAADAATEQQKPEPTSAHKFSPNSALVAGVATLVLAMGVGVMIGRSGGGSSNAAAPVPQVIRVGGGAETAEATSSSAKEKTKSENSKGDSKTKAKAKAETGSSGTTKAAEEVLKPAGDVKLPPPTTQPGEDCEKGTAGCSDSGEFNGSFFGEE